MKQDDGDTQLLFAVHYKLKKAPAGKGIDLMEDSFRELRSGVFCNSPLIQV